jgi:LSD1 subclass zinc finger protein
VPPWCIDFEFATLAVAYNASVMIAKDLLEILVCPACKQPLEYRESPESLKCKQCRRVYAVKDDIPIMLVDEAMIEG